MSLAAMLVGPLVGPECQRMARKRWLPVVRVLAAGLVAVPAVVAVWWWWLSGEVDPEYRPGWAISTALGAVEGIAITIALVLSPAILAGSLAGEKERGSIGLLLSTRVDCREIVLGRLLGKLSLVGSIVGAAAPFVVAFAVLSDFTIGSILGLLLFPAIVGFGAGGLAIAASSVAKKGRNALMGVYLAQILLLLAPLLGLAPGLSVLSPFLAAFNPFQDLPRVLSRGGAGVLLPAMATWTIMGVLGVVFASWRLRPSSIGRKDGKGGLQIRRYRVAAMDERRPMLWKKLQIERVGALGWFGRLLGLVLVLVLGVGSLVLAGVCVWAKMNSNDALFDQYALLMGSVYGDTSSLFACLIEIAIGLRAAVAVSSERERNTWDALMTSPLSGREILTGKLWGSLYSLRWLVLSTLIAWVSTLAVGGMTKIEFASAVGQVVVIGPFVAALGVRASLATATATKSMTITVALWLASLFVVSIVSAIAMAGVMFVCLMGWMMANSLGLVPVGGRPWMPVQWFGPGVLVVGGSMYVALTLAILVEARGRFDDLAGRVRGENAEKPMKPRRLFGKKAKPSAPAPMPREQMAESATF